MQHEAKLYIDDEFTMPTSAVELCDLATELWMQYFVPAEPLSSTEKRNLRDKYNMVAKKANDVQGHCVLQLITPSTVWIPKKDEVGQPIPPHKGKAANASIKAIAANAKNTAAPAASEAPKVQRTPGAGGSIIQQIIALHVEGKSNKEIIALGFNKSTVGRQVSEYKKRLENEQK